MNQLELDFEKPAIQLKPGLRIKFHDRLGRGNEGILLKQVPSGAWDIRLCKQKWDWCVQHFADAFYVIS